MKSETIWMDGKFVPYEQATVHVLNPTMHYGTGVFEGIRCYETPRGPAVFRLREHLERFLDSVQIAGVRDFPYSYADLHAAVHETIRANGFKSCYIRPLMYMVGPLGLNLDAWKPAVTIAVWEWAPFLGEESITKGVRVGVSSFTRHHPNVMMTKAKISGNYVNSTLAKTVATRSGFDEAIMLDPQGFVAECSGENLFVVRDGVIYTPPRSTILEGITRDTVITLARDNGIQVIEEPISRDQLYIADEIFLCGTAAEVVPVRSVDFREISPRNGSSNHKVTVTSVVQKAFFNVIRGDGRRAEEWLDYVTQTEFAG